MGLSKYWYSVCGFTLTLTKLSPSLQQSWTPFQSPAEVPPDFTIDILPQQIGRYGLETLPLREGECSLIRNGSEIMLVNEDWTHCRILAPENWDLASAFLTMVFDTHALRRRMVHLHCSTVADRGRGILFLGPSGIGKTTQAERWRDYRGSLIINGDMGYVQQTEKGFTAWGTPWHGSSPYCENTSVPLKAMVVLKQASENKLRLLTGFERVQEISGNVIYPQWMEQGMELCLSTLDALLTDLPVYRLDNRADEEGVELLAKELDRIAPPSSLEEEDGKGGPEI